MKNLLTIIFCLVIFIAKGQSKNATDGSLISTGAYPVITMKDIRGFSLSVQTISDRNGIDTAYRWIGMMLGVVQDSSIYTLSGGKTNADWVKLSSSGGSSSSSTFTVTQSAVLDGTQLDVVIPTGLTSVPTTVIPDVSDPYASQFTIIVGATTVTIHYSNGIIGAYIYTLTITP